MYRWTHKDDPIKKVKNCTSDSGGVLCGEGEAYPGVTFLQVNVGRNYFGTGFARYFSLLTEILRNHTNDLIPLIS